uniref:Uncharacterized protein n=1 Tax=Rhizophora mucronata TaxID=61149 RepID=A0A2P2JGW9_RHIMU
MVRASHAQLR